MPGPPQQQPRSANTVNSARKYAGRTPRLHVLMVSSEVAPWAKTGGLADVLGGLPASLVRHGHAVTVVLPRYRGINPGTADVRAGEVILGTVRYPVAWHVRQEQAGVRTVFVDCPVLFDRAGLYGSGGQDFADNADRFAVLAAAALDFAERDAGPAPSVVHAHDWQAGLVPVLLRTQPRRWPRLSRAGLVFTIHNLAYQGRFPKDIVPRFGLDWQVFTMEGAEFWNELSYLKGGIAYSDYVTTVSPRYAEETLTPAFGYGFEGALTALGDRYIGILNGIDPDVWNPGTDVLLPAHFSADDLSGKRECKRALLNLFQLPQGDDALARPVVAMVSRLVAQKGLDWVHEASDELMSLDATWIIVGTGDRTYEQMWQTLRDRHPSRVGVFFGFDEARAHLAEAGADLFLMPSKFEPCGLNQMYSLRYGTVPVVHGVGGLDDTIRGYRPNSRHANGFKFSGGSASSLVATLRQALRLYHNPPQWARLMAEGMSDDHSWDQAAREYVKVYKRARRDARDL
ncbi:MAG: glycogen synthase GlgA [Acidobacteria bacterium]|nr:glycogen synthase GlgA [Acidobacteriota bacterium]